MTFTFGSLFAGIGGFDLGLERAGMVCKWQVEIDPFCNKVLEKHWPNVRRYKNVKEVHGVVTYSNERGCSPDIRKKIPKRKIEEITNPEFGSRDTRRNGIYRQGCPSCLEPVDLICGGFPCQPFSCAGKRKGKEDDRALWPEMFRIIQELKPRWVLGENVAGIINMELENCFSDLEMEGYEVQALVIPACAVQAPHRRDRVWIVANRQSTGTRSNERRLRNIFVGKNRGKKADCHAPDTATNRLHNIRVEGWLQKESFNSVNSRSSVWSEPWLEVATRLCGMDARISNRVDRLKCLGNSVVPQIVEILGRAILWTKKQ